MSHIVDIYTLINVGFIQTEKLLNRGQSVCDTEINYCLINMLMTPETLITRIWIAHTRKHTLTHILTVAVCVSWSSL